VSTVTSKVRGVISWQGAAESNGSAEEEEEEEEKLVWSLE